MQHLLSQSSALHCSFWAIRQSVWNLTRISRESSQFHTLCRIASFCCVVPRLVGLLQVLQSEGREIVVFSKDILMAKLSEVEQLSARIRVLEEDSEEQRELIYRWAVVGDEVTRSMIQAEEQLTPVQLLLLKAEVNGNGLLDLWAKYRESEWRVPRFGGPGPGDDPLPTMSLRDFLK
jgi:hypothetical protein